jgi:hypothetical protein
MRTTLDLDPPVLDALRQFASHRAVSLGKAVSELVMKGLRTAPDELVNTNGFPVFQTQKNSPMITLEDVKRHLDGEA